ncbi:formylglycine-generating enzyme family protein [Pontibacter sp. 13R65]|uniref:formylglycine-generating enzyme family protein n=1 Tax=Pontibacter sp. 13R65 TaxID=3127458 RepID=UPI00301C0A2D
MFWKSKRLEEALQNLMVPLPAGTVELRDDRIKQQWEEIIQPFWLAKFPVTQELFKMVTDSNPSTFLGDQRPVETLSWKEAADFCNLLSEQAGLASYYVVSKTSEAIKFDAKANGFRLPTEAEWVYACKAGTTGIRYGELNDIGWYKQNSQKQTQPVGLKEPNSWGLYDMLGNVWEWCSDVYDQTVYGSYRIIKGGGWCDEERGCMATNRRRSHPTSFRIDDLGFRLARNREENENAGTNSAKTFSF